MKFTEMGKNWNAKVKGNKCLRNGNERRFPLFVFVVHPPFRRIFTFAHHWGMEGGNGFGWLVGHFHFLGREGEK